MNHPDTSKYSRQRLFATIVVLLLEMAQLAWEYFHGGIASHHFLRRADMPAISNAWGLILLPALTWFLVGRIQQRLLLSNGSRSTRNAIAATFAAAMLFGVLLSFCFSHGYKDATEYLFLGMLVAAVLLPVYRAECVLGFVLGMVFHFGPVLPTLIALLLAAISATVHWLIRGAIAFARARFSKS